MKAEATLPNSIIICTQSGCFVAVWGAENTSLFCQIFCEYVPASAFLVLLILIPIDEGRRMKKHDDSFGPFHYSCADARTSVAQPMRIPRVLSQSLDSRTNCRIRTVRRQPDFFRSNIIRMGIIQIICHSQGNVGKSHERCVCVYPKSFSLSDPTN